MAFSMNLFCLPAELRRQIWEYLIPPPTVQIPHIDTNPDTGELHLKPTPGAPHSVLLRICRESRLLALEHYTLAFGSSYIDFDLDTVYYMYTSFAEAYTEITDFEIIKTHTTQLHRSKIQHVAIDCQMWNNTAWSLGDSEWDKVAERVLVDGLESFSNLQTLTIIIRMPECFSGPGPEYDGELFFVEEPRWGPWDRQSVLQDFYLGDKWQSRFPTGWSTDEEDAATFEEEKLDIEDQVRDLQEKYPEKRFPEIRWRFLIHENEYV